MSIGDELETRFVVSAHVSVKGIDAMESAASWRGFFIEMDLLATGRNSKGERLALDADGVSWCGIMLFAQSDFEKHVSWGLGNFRSTATPCQSCYESRLADMPLTDLRPNAGWRPTSVMTDVQYRSRCLKPHPLQSSHYFNRFLVRFDVMHAVDDNGVSGSVMASVIGYFILYERRLGTTQALRLEAISSRLATFNSTNAISSRLFALKVQNIFPRGTSSWAAMHGPAVKAANVRCTVPFLEVLCREFCGTSVEHVAMKRLTTALCTFYDVIFDGSYFLSDANFQRLD